MTKRSEPGDVLDMTGMQQLVDHVKNQQRLHAVVGKAFPSLSERDVAEPARMPKEGAVLRVMHGRSLLRRFRFSKLFALRAVAQPSWLGGRRASCSPSRSPCLISKCELRAG